VDQISKPTQAKTQSESRRLSSDTKQSGPLRGTLALVAIFPLVGCGTCGLCRSGLENLCRERSLLGLHSPGTFAERVAVREDRLVTPRRRARRARCLVEPLAASIAALDPHKTVEGRRVVVIGCGSIGLLPIYVARVRGAEVDAVDPVESRRRVALPLGAGRVFEHVAAVPEGAANVVLDAVGVEATWTAGLRLLRPGGTIVVVGLGRLSGSVPVGLMVRSGSVFAARTPAGVTTSRQRLSYFARVHPMPDG
jgi:threonine dehydrogenase-like Zn-dependent dehydrogenase